MGSLTIVVTGGRKLGSDGVVYVVVAVAMQPPALTASKG